MEKKLILSIDEVVIQTAKEYAQKQGVSLSSLVENFLKRTTESTSHKQKKKASHSSVTEGLIGIIKHVKYENDDYRMHQGKKHGVN